MDAEAVERIEAQLIVLARAMEAVYRRRGYPMERAHYLVLRLLGDRPMSIGDLARELALEHSTATRQVEAMRKAGLIERLANPIDKRSVLVQATQQGVALCNEMRAFRRARIEDLIDKWNDGDREDLANLLSRFNDEISRMLASPLRLSNVAPTIRGREP